MQTITSSMLDWLNLEVLSSNTQAKLIHKVMINYTLLTSFCTEKEFLPLFTAFS